MRFMPAKSLLPRLLLPLAFGCVVLSLARGTAIANDTFVIAANDGYGIGECLATNSSCGRIVADAWCEAHGRAKSISWGAADDVTGSIETISTTRKTPDAFIVTCGD